MFCMPPMGAVALADRRAESAIWPMAADAVVLTGLTLRSRGFDFSGISALAFSWSFGGGWILGYWAAVAWRQRHERGLP